MDELEGDCPAVQSQQTSDQEFAKPFGRLWEMEDQVQNMEDATSTLVLSQREESQQCGIVINDSWEECKQKFRNRKKTRNKERTFEQSV